jgi:hypothetical protein
MGDRDYPNTIVEIEINESLLKTPERTETRTRFILGRVQIGILTYAIQGSLEFLTEFST